jgi:ribosomal protein S18 acetylase RimI-like enzyme
MASVIRLGGDKDMNDIREIASEASWADAHEVMQSFRPTLSREAFLSSRVRLISEGYRLLALYDENRIQSLAGFIVSPHVLNGRELRINDLVTRTASRSRGYGKRILGELERIASEEGCFRILLYSRLENVDAHDFYESKGGFVRYGIEFIKSIER